MLPMVVARLSVLLWWRCDMLYTSGFVVDIMFARNRPGHVLKVTHQREARAGESPACFLANNAENIDCGQISRHA